MTQNEILAQKLASGEYWLNETWFFVWLPLITVAVYVIIRLRYRTEWEWLPLLYVLVCSVVLVLYHSPGDWNTIISGWIDAVSWPTDKTGVQFNSGWFGKILNYVYLGLLILVVWATYLFDKHGKL